MLLNLRWAGPVLGRGLSLYAGRFLLSMGTENVSSHHPAQGVVGSLWGMAANVHPALPGGRQRELP